MLLPCTGIGNDQEKLVSSEENALCEARERRVAEQSRPKDKTSIWFLLMIQGKSVFGPECLRITALLSTQPVSCLGHLLFSST